MRLYTNVSFLVISIGKFSVLNDALEKRGERKKKDRMLCKLYEGEGPSGRVDFHRSVSEPYNFADTNDRHEGTQLPAAPHSHKEEDTICVHRSPRAIAVPITRMRQRR